MSVGQWKTRTWLICRGVSWVAVVFVERMIDVVIRWPGVMVWAGVNLFNGKTQTRKTAE